MAGEKAKTEKKAKPVEQPPEMCSRHVRARGWARDGDPKCVVIDLSAHPILVDVQGVWTGANVVVAQRALVQAVQLVKSARIMREKQAERETPAPEPAGDTDEAVAASQQETE